MNFERNNKNIIQKWISKVEKTRKMKNNLVYQIYFYCFLILEKKLDIFRYIYTQIITTIIFNLPLGKFNKNNNEKLRKQKTPTQHMNRARPRVVWWAEATTFFFFYEMSSQKKQVGHPLFCPLKKKKYYYLCFYPICSIKYLKIKTHNKI